MKDQAKSDLVAENERLRAERDGWIDSARYHANGQEFYHGIVRKIGALFGEAARTSDDGSVQDDILALRLPELVQELQIEWDTLAAHVIRMRKVFTQLHLKSPSPVEVLQAYSYVMRDTPSASLAARDKRIATAAFKAGFEVSGEGFNGEYPSDATETSIFKDDLQGYLKSIERGEES
ncbi:hypothetical protein C7446_2518 [Kushneria sinocarnis]|uniref:Uncharacterized protein n=1 Tax=Kushneria sinocarnis TaxID=595502 RepID=A0A420WUG8_9GAMM|nr:hypothetical protein [Kushneria sinocarnis]RKQ97099.1 hypothetical protein C7446_2518 [Kushneria sinocarnis]